MTVSTVTIYRRCRRALVITLLPSAAISASGKPSGVGVVREGPEAGEVAARGLGPALEHVAGHDGTGHLVVRRRRPAVVRDRRSDDDARVGDPSGDDDVGARAQGGCDAEPTQVGVGGQGLRSAPAPGRSPAGRRPDVRDDAASRPRPAAISRTWSARPAGLKTAGVADDLHAALQGEAEAVLELADERLRVAQRGVLHRVPPRISMVSSAR